MSPEALMTAVRDHGYRRLVLSDINNTSAVLDSLRTASTHGLSVVPGVDFRNGSQQQYIAVAKNNDGYGEICSHLSKHLHQGIPFSARAPEFRNVYVIYPTDKIPGSLRPYEFAGISPGDLKHATHERLQIPPEKQVVLQTVTFRNRKDFNAHRLLRAIDTNTLISTLDVAEQGDPADQIISESGLTAVYEETPHILQNTAALLDDCNVTFEFGKLSNKNLRYVTSGISEDERLLRKLAYDGLAYRYPSPSEVVLERIERELKVIAELGFCSYFLINHEIVSYARSRNYFYVGRGSGANSMVAYLLRITDVDPIDLDLYFERFINRHRNNAPDFDIDFSWTDRDDITRFIFERFGYERTALLGTYSTFQGDAVLREVGKVFGLPPSEIDRLQSKKEAADHVGSLVLKYSQYIHGFPRHLGIHASGIIISERPVTCYGATFMPPKGYPATQFSMLEAEDIGLYKFDILSQRGLGKIRDAVELVKQNRGVDIDIHRIADFKQDPAIRKLLRVGKCIGCFYVESPAMRMLLAKLQADDYLRLVAASSIIRPGVSKSGMMREYILRYRDPDRRERARRENPALYDLLAETYGVMVYQEDVIKIAHLFAGLSLEDADYLRRGMSWKFKLRDEFSKVKDRFFSNCLSRKYPFAVVQDIWTQIESFANFAFSKGHSASYAVESYQALYLKAHFPVEYMVATLNNGGGYYRKDVYIHEARLHGATVYPPCINSSGELCTVKGNKVYLGLGMISDIESALLARIISERNTNGPFTGLYDFTKRVHAGIEQIRLLVRSGAFHSFGKNKKEMLWEVQMMVNPLKPNDAPGLFDVQPQQYTLPKLEISWVDDAFEEIELFGFSLCSPFKLLKEKVSNMLTASRLPAMNSQTVEIIGYLVAVKNSGTGRGDKMHFGTFLDVEGAWIDTVHFPPSARSYPFTGPGCYRIIGKVTEEFDFVCIDVEYLYRLPMLDRESPAQITEYLPQPHL